MKFTIFMADPVARERRFTKKMCQMYLRVNPLHYINQFSFCDVNGIPKTIRSCASGHLLG
jgi:hypothetical protein